MNLSGWRYYSTLTIAYIVIIAGVSMVALGGLISGIFGTILIILSIASLEYTEKEKATSESLGWARCLNDHPIDPGDYRVKYGWKQLDTIFLVTQSAKLYCLRTTALKMIDQTEGPIKGLIIEKVGPREYAYRLY